METLMRERKLKLLLNTAVVKSKACPVACELHMTSLWTGCYNTTKPYDLNFNFKKVKHKSCFYTTNVCCYRVFSWRKEEAACHND